jgi:hypothetical protein
MVVQVLEQLAGRRRDGVVVVLGRPLLGVDQRRPVDLVEVPEREAVAGLGLLGRLRVEGEVPPAVAVVTVLVDERVLVIGRRCGVRPLRGVVVRAGVDELACLVDPGLVHSVRRHAGVLPTNRRAKPARS